MATSLKDIISADRLRKQNPYAFLDGEGGFDAVLANSVGKSNDGLISADRLKMENPYAHLNSKGDYDAIFTQEDEKLCNPTVISLEDLKSQTQAEGASESKRGYSYAQIEKMATRFQRLIWEKRNQIWSSDSPSNPIKILNPEKALNSIGYSFDVIDSLGQYSNEGELVEVAGTIDRELKKVQVSRQVALNVRNFTAAHELGHAILHEANGLHRDRPLDGSAMKVLRNPIEAEADKFASCFLMPEKLVRKTFRGLFLTECFILNDESLFALALNKGKELKQKCKSARDLAKVLASAEHYDGVHFDSLANQFHVSVEAMAIRLEELALFKY